MAISGRRPVRPDGSLYRQMRRQRRARRAGGVVGGRWFAIVLLAAALAGAVTVWVVWF